MPHRRGPAGLSSFGSLTELAKATRLGRDALAFHQLVQVEEGEREEAEVYRKNPADQVYTFERWHRHRQPARYARYLLHMFSSRVFRSLRPAVVAVMVLTTFVGVYETLLKAGAFPGHWPHLSLALGQAWSLTGFALSLLLAFRTNHSYDRWWEARKLWGGIVNRCRDLVRQGLLWFPSGDTHSKEQLARWVATFPKVLMCHLREDGDLKELLKGLLPPDELRALLASHHRPSFVIQMLGETVVQSRVDPATRSRMDFNITFLEDCVGSCERILRTPIPLSYTRHTSRFLLVWLIMLPLTLWAAYKWLSIPLSGILGFLMMGIDEIGIQIEEPFGVLPLDAISATVERNIRELLIIAAGVRGLAQPSPAPADDPVDIYIPASFPAHTPSAPPGSPTCGPGGSPLACPACPAAASPAVNVPPGILASALGRSGSFNSRARLHSMAPPGLGSDTQEHALVLLPQPSADLYLRQGPADPAAIQLSSGADVSASEDAGASSSDWIKD